MDKMKVTNTIITKMAEATSENGKYNLEYNITDGVLERVQITVYKNAEEEEQPAAIGSIFYDRGSMTANLPYSSDMAQYLADAAECIGTILQEVAAKAAQLSDDSTNHQA